MRTQEEEEDDRYLKNLIVKAEHRKWRKVE